MALTTFNPAFPVISSVTEGITATASGTQATGVQLVSRYNGVTTCATTGDSVVLPPWQPDLDIIVENTGAAACGVYPYPGQQISTASVNAAFNVTAAKTCLFRGSGTLGKWLHLLSA